MQKLRHVNNRPMAEQQLCPQDLNVAENSTKYIQLHLKNSNHKLVCILHRNSHTKIFAKIINMPSCQLELEATLHGNADLEIAYFIENCKNVKLDQKICLSEKASRVTIRNACKADKKDNITIQT
jgi:hypothetical protein